ncbi:MAG: M20/M25/M40 family metallo-hydrolase [Proteobacteria bacterium]|nr:M20/M25/M40 family metallo-hydrolase [Pseudomonadota bacterium]
MKNTMRLLFATYVQLLAVAIQAQAIPDDVMQRAATLRDNAMRGSEAYRIVESLTMEVGPRSAGSAGDKAGVLWAVDMLKSLGLKNVRREEVLVPHWDRGTISVRITSPFPQSLVATSLGGSPGTPAEGIEAEVVRVESLAELRALESDDLQGRIVYIDHIMQRAKDGGGYSKASRIRSCGHVVAAERGAVATIIRSAGTSMHRVAHTGSMLKNFIPADIPGVAISNADADLLSYQMRSGRPVMLRLHSTARFLPDVVSANVIGEVPGRGDDAGEIVLLAAHLDSWDLGTGAIDDGAGVAIVSAAAKLILDLDERPRRTIRVVLYADEEFGGKGAKQYLKDHADQVENHIIGLEADFGSGRVWRIASQVAAGSLDIIDELHRLLEPIDLKRGDNKATGGADLGPLRKAGMPVIGLTHDGTHYFDYHHTVDDTLDKINRDDLNQSVAAYTTAAFVAANIEQDFGRLPLIDKKTTCAAEDDK